MSNPETNKPNFVQKFQIDHFGMTTTEAQSKKICILCKKSAEKFKDSLSKQEYELSAMCQKCQDKIFT